MITIKKIPAYQTSDNKSFVVQEDAIRHEFLLGIRGFLQSKLNGKVRDSYTGFEVANAIAQNPEEIVKLYKQYTHSLTMAFSHRKRKVRQQNEAKEQTAEDAALNVLTENI